MQVDSTASPSTLQAGQASLPARPNSTRPCLPSPHTHACACRPDGGSITLQAGQSLRLTTDASAAASAEQLPINWPGDFTQGGLKPGATVFVGQYLFTGAETSSAYLTVQKVSRKCADLSRIM